jgi:FkbM family methyltransferase
LRPPIDNGPASKIAIDDNFEGFQNTTTTINIDDFVARYDIQKIDFIQMDIDGAEMEALHGARETLRRFTPKLAICVYII